MQHLGFVPPEKPGMMSLYAGLYYGSLDGNQSR